MRNPVSSAQMSVLVFTVASMMYSVSSEDLQVISASSEHAPEREGDDYDDMARMLEFSSIIYPGTMYCGQGNITGTYIPPEKYLAAEDACCKGHDECDRYILPGQTDPISGLTNDCYVTQCDCACEDKFFKCLKAIGSMHANIIGRIYFSGMVRKCYTKSVPLKCKSGVFWQTMDPTTCRSCNHYCTNYRDPPSYHWRPTALYQNSYTALTDHPPCYHD